MQRLFSKRLIGGTLPQGRIVGLEGSLAARAMAAEMTTALGGKADAATTTAALDLRELTAHRGQPNGYADLDVAGKLVLDRLCAHGHLQAEITNLVSDLGGKAALSHGHAQADVVGLVLALAGKTDLGHGHAQVDVAGLVADLAARPPMLVARTAADVTSTITALADVTGLSVALEPNRDYGFQLLLLYRSAAVGCGVTLTLNGPAPPAGRDPGWDSGIETTGGPSTSAIQHKAQSAADGLHTTASVDTANATRIARLAGVWPVGGAGAALRARLASEVAGTEVKIMKGSWLLAF